MITEEDGTVTLSHPDGWRAVHDEKYGPGPTSVSLLGTRVLRNPSVYVDEMAGDSAVLESQRFHRKAGTALVESKWTFPFGREVRFAQTCRYAANHVRITIDVHWPRGALVKRHFGLGTLFLPGKWDAISWIAPAAALTENFTVEHRTVPASPASGKMLAHWHRPPLAVVFQSESGMHVEIGTGNDLWRWEKGMESGLDSGSYKILYEADGLRFVREPLMCCAPYSPPGRTYRFTWYAAWSVPAGVQQEADGDEGELLQFSTDRDVSSFGRFDTESVEVRAGGVLLVLDLQRIKWPVEFCRCPSAASFIRGNRSSAPCWHHNGLQKNLRRIIRQIKEHFPAGHLRIRNASPGICWDPAHLSKSEANGLPHWDMGALLDFSEWTRQQLGRHWTFAFDCDDLLQFPSLNGLFGENGFDAHA